MRKHGKTSFIKFTFSAALSQVGRVSLSETLSLHSFLCFAAFHAYSNVTSYDLQVLFCMQAFPSKCPYSAETA